MIHASKNAVRTVFYIPNNPEGQDLLKRMKGALNSKHHRLRVLGRHENRKQLAQQLNPAETRYANGQSYGYWNGTHASLRQRVPLKHATYFAVYVDSPEMENQLRGQSTATHYYNEFVKANKLAQAWKIQAEVNQEQLTIYYKELAATSVSPSWRKVWEMARGCLRRDYHTLISRLKGLVA